MLALTLLVLTGLDGRPVSINPAQITRLYHGTDQPNKTVAKDAQCVVAFTDGKFVAVKESCETIRQKLEEKK